MEAGWRKSGWGSEDRSRTIDINRPNGPVVAIVRSKTLAIVREPDVDNVVFRTGKQEIALLIEFYLGQRPLVACVK